MSSPIALHAGRTADDDKPVQSPAGVLFVASPRGYRAPVRDRLNRCGVNVEAVVDLSEAVSRLATARWALCLIDLGDERTSIASIRLLRSQFPEQPMAGLIDPANPVAAAEAVYAGLGDLLPWPFEDRDFLLLVANARDRHGVELEMSRPGSAAEALFAQAPAMRPVLDLIRTAATATGGVVICGEPGSGRELIARVVHAVGEPKEMAAFVMVDCAGIAPQELERKLFGIATEHRPQSARTPSAERVGPESGLLRARGGTLYLTGLTDVPTRLQTRLARVLRDREAAVGDSREIVDLDFRIIGSFEPGIEDALADGRLRPELFERMSQIRIDVPPLRRRRQDIPMLAAHFVDELCREKGLPPRTFSRSALSLLAALPWHGNAIELRALLDTVLGSVRRPVIQIDDLLAHASLDGITPRIDTGMTLRDARARFERECISAVLVRHQGRVGEAAKALGIQRTNLYRKVRQLNVARSLLSTRK